MKRFIFRVALATFVFTLGASIQTPTAKAQSAAEENLVLKEEMRLVDAAFKNLITSLILEEPEKVEAPFHQVHKAKQRTEKALHAGDIVLPKNNDKLKQFLEMDEAFHASLKKILKASRAKDMPALQKATHEALDGCVGCHQTYRK